MPVQKFKTFLEAEEALWQYEPDEAYYKSIKELFILSQKLNPTQFPKGIFKFKTLKEANQQKMEWIIEQAKHKRQEKNTKYKI